MDAGVGAAALGQARRAHLRPGCAQQPRQVSTKWTLLQGKGVPDLLPALSHGVKRTSIAIIQDLTSVRLHP